MVPVVGVVLWTGVGLRMVIKTVSIAAQGVLEGVKLFWCHFSLSLSAQFPTTRSALRGAILVTIGGFWWTRQAGSIEITITPLRS
jgi:hypothetical protein